MLTFLL